MTQNRQICGYMPTSLSTLETTNGSRQSTRYIQKTKLNASRMKIIRVWTRMPDETFRMHGVYMLRERHGVGALDLLVDTLLIGDRREVRLLVILTIKPFLWGIQRVY